LVQFFLTLAARSEDSEQKTNKKRQFAQCAVVRRKKRTLIQS